MNTLEQAWTAKSLTCAVALLLAATAAPRTSHGGSIHPILARAAAQSPGDTLSVWVAFADKGWGNGRDLALRLAAAEAALSPRNRARRLRAGIRPLVDERDLPVHEPYLRALERHGLRPYAVSRWANRAVVRVPARVLDRLAVLPGVAGLEPVPRARRDPRPTIEVLPQVLSRPARLTAVDYGQTATMLQQIGVPALHDSGYTGAGVLIAVFDEGFNFVDKHEALRDLAIPPGRRRDFIRGVADVQDTTSAHFLHGTWVLGGLAGRRFGTYVGAAYGAEFALARTEDRPTETPQEMIWWGLAAEWADSLGADVISSSVGYSTFDNPADNYTYADMDGRTTAVSRAAQVAAAKGILVVNSAGNTGNTSWRYVLAPADVQGDSLIAAGAVDAAGVPAAFSAYGPTPDGRIKPDLAARGVSNPLPATSGDPQAYTNLSGTSFSAPLIAGLAACLLQARPAWTAVQVIAGLRATASRAGAPDDRVGYGIPNGAALLDTVPPSGAGGRPLLVLAGPNPVDFGRREATLRLDIPGALAARAPRFEVHVLDVTGRRVRELWSGVITSPGSRLLTWDGRDLQGRPSPPGVYVVRVRAGGEEASARLTALR